MTVSRYAEAVTYAEQGYDGQVEVTLTLIRADDSTFGQDTVRLKATPFILLGNTNSLEKVYVSDLDPAFVGALEGIFGAEVVVPLDSSVYNYNQFPQDEAEIGYVQFPGLIGDRVAQVVCDLPRNRGLDPWLETLLGPGFGHFDSPGTASAADYGGNLEVSPPVTVGETEYKLGRAVVGGNMSGALKGFLAAQGVQTPLIELNAGWLHVAHMDEVISFVPSGGGFKVLIASPARAIDLLDALNVVDTGTASDGTSTTLTDSGKSWAGDTWAAGVVQIYDGTGAGQFRQVAGNTADTLTVTRAWETNPDGTSEYKVEARSAYLTLFTTGPEDVGVVTGATANTLTDSTKVWVADAWVGGHVLIIGGPAGAQVRKIVGNTATQLSLEESWGQLPDSACRYVVAQGSKSWADGKAAMIPVCVILLFRSWNGSLENIIEGVQTSLKNELGLEDSDFVPVPVYFSPLGSKAMAWTPNMVNSLIGGSAVASPDPFGPRPVGGDPLVQEFKTKIETLGLDCYFVDDWDTYHAVWGEVHCGTNAKRSAPSGVKWWE